MFICIHQSRKLKLSSATQPRTHVLFRNPRMVTKKFYKFEGSVTRTRFRDLRMGSLFPGMKVEELDAHWPNFRHIQSFAAPQSRDIEIDRRNFRPGAQWTCDAKDRLPPSRRQCHRRTTTPGPNRTLTMPIWVTRTGASPPPSPISTWPPKPLCKARVTPASIGPNNSETPSGVAGGAASSRVFAAVADPPPSCSAVAANPVSDAHAFVARIPAT